MKRNKGFTLIELLAVIVILAIIALIATPLILNVIYESEHNSFKETANGVLRAGDLYIAKNSNSSSFDLNTADDTFKLLQYKGGKITDGRFISDAMGKVNFVIKNSSFCAYKNEFDNDKDVVHVVGKKDPEFSSIKCDIYSMDGGGLIAKPALYDGCFQYQEKSDNTASIVGYKDDETCPKTNLVIPRKVNGLKVTEIGKEAFSNSPGREPNSVLIGGELYSGTLTFHDDITVIGDRAFSDSREITGVLNFPSNLKKIGAGAFSNTMIDGNLVFPNSLVEIGDYAFLATKIRNISFGNGLMVIGEGAFDGSTRIDDWYPVLNDIVFPESLVSVGKYAFRKVSYSGDLKFGGKLKFIGNGAFIDNDIVNVYIKNSAPNVIIEGADDWNVNIIYE